MGSASRLSAHLAFASAAVPLVIANPWGLDTHALPKALAMAVLALAALGVVGATGTWRVIPRTALVWAALLLSANVLSLTFSQDWRGSFLGAYQHRHGFVTQVGLLALVAALTTILILAHQRGYDIFAAIRYRPFMDTTVLVTAELGAVAWPRPHSRQLKLVGLGMGAGPAAAGVDHGPAVPRRHSAVVAGDVRLIVLDHVLRGYGRS